jgi:hypothetical protein
MRALASALAVALSSTVGCAPPPDAPTADDGAAHLGLVAGTTKTYASSTGATETHEHVASDILLPDGLSVGLIARENGFAKEERSLTFGVDLEQASLVRFYSCLNACATPSAPIPFIGWPLRENARTEGEATVTVSENGAVVETRTERHATTVGAPAPVTVPAGTFDAFIVSWSRTRIDARGDEETETAVLHWVPDIGIVKHDTFDGVTLELQSFE